MFEAQQVLDRNLEIGLLREINGFQLATKYSKRVGEINLFFYNSWNYFWEENFNELDFEDKKDFLKNKPRANRFENTYLNSLLKCMEALIYPRSEFFDVESIESILDTGKPVLTCAAIDPFLRIEDSGQANYHTAQGIPIEITEYDEKYFYFSGRRALKHKLFYCIQKLSYPVMIWRET